MLEIKCHCKYQCNCFFFFLSESHDSDLIFQVCFVCGLPYHLCFVPGINFVVCSSFEDWQDGDQLKGGCNGTDGFVPTWLLPLDPTERVIKCKRGCLHAQHC